MLQRAPSSNHPWQVLVPSGPGGKEVFVGSMLMFFPTHQDQELEFLKTSWGSWSHMWSCSTIAKPNEGGKTLAWGHPQNTPAKQTPGFLYQPIDEMRDYFGEQVTMYFSWLGPYTKVLASLSILSALRGRLSALSISNRKSVSCGGFLWTHGCL